jgi:hypothetical protein
VAQLIKILFNVLPVTNCQGRFNHSLNFAHFIAQQTLYFIAHGFSAGGAEMDFYPVCGLVDFLYKVGALRVLYIFVIGICIHNIPFRRKYAPVEK